MVEPVRLVIWDLDETFWNGTLTEGGIEYRRDTHEIVLELARRGIMSSICSKNDLSAVREVLEREGIWDSFIFPSVNWEPKGQRIASLIETVQLRPATVMFIDDNSMNLREAQHFTPELQVVDQHFIGQILDSPLFKGKDDRELSRLKQYKLLEQRKADESSAGSDNVQFLRSCDIRVEIERDVEKHIDRAIELINRTNQLNFTKNRLPEKPEAARRKLLKWLEKFNTQAGLIRVVDKYGDYGFVGFYMTRTNAKSGVSLKQFCFSCRILNMGVETWMYRRLGRPELAVEGEVLTDVIGDTQEIDWIRVEGESNGASDSDAQAAAGTPRYGRIFTRGGCELRALTHYFGMASDNVVGEFNDVRNGLKLRSDHSCFLRLALEGLPPGGIESLRALGFHDEDFRSALLDPVQGRQLTIFGFWLDAALPVYRHRTLGFRLPFYGIPKLGEGKRKDVSHLTAEDLGPDHAYLADAIAHLRDNYVFEPPLDEQGFKENLRIILDRCKAMEQVVLLAGNESLHKEQRANARVLEPMVRLNAWMREVAADYPNVSIVDTREAITDEAEVVAARHFDRMVYFRLYQRIMEVGNSSVTAEAAA